jgi:hypothetical protein
MVKIFPYNARYTETNQLKEDKMNKDKEKLVEVVVKNGDTEEKVNIVVKRPTNAVLSQAQRVGAKAWTDCVRDGIMTKKELEKFMKEQGIWDDGKDEEQKKIIQEISNLEKSLYVGHGPNSKLKASDGKDIAIQMRVKRNELRDLIAERMSLEQNTAEAISDNARFDFLVSSSVYYENGTRVYTDLDNYRENADSEIGFAAASALASMLYSVDRDFEAKLPENKFLKMFNFVNEDLSLVNDKGETVDTEGRRIDKSGYYLNDEGKRVDKDGNVLDEFGNYIPTVTYITEDSEVKTSKPKKVKVSDSN